MIYSRPQNGFSMVEALVAIAILLIAIVGPLTIVSRGLEGAVFAREQATAAFLAQEGFELVYKLRDDAGLASINPGVGAPPAAWDWTTNSRWSDCFTSSGCGLHLDDTGAVNPTPVACDPITDCALRFDDSVRARYNHDSGDATSYTRVIRLGSFGTGVEVRSQVTWSAGPLGARQVVEVWGYLYDIHD